MMPRVFRPLFAGLALLVLVGRTNLAAAKDEWLKIDAGDFLVYTDASQKAATTFAVRYAAYRTAFRETLLAPNEELPPSVLIVFRKSRTFLEYTPDHVREDNVTLLNYSIEVDGTSLNAFSSESGSAEAITSTMEFETVWMLKRLGYWTPVWMSQGAGKVLATTAGKRSTWIVGTMPDTSFMYPWKQLFEIGRESKEYRGPDNSEYHAQIWTLMHWVLFKDEQTQPRFQKLALRLRTDLAGDALAATLGTPPSGFRKEIDRHLRNWKPRAVKFDEATFLARLKVSPAPRAEVLVWTSEFLGAAGKDWRGDTNLNEAYALAPELAIVQEAWARRMIRDNRPDDALLASRRAIAAGSRNYASFLATGSRHLEKAAAIAAQTRKWAGAGGQAADLAVEDLRTAVQLNRGSERALSEFGRALYFSPVMRDADVELLRECVRPGEEGAFARIQLAMVISRSTPNQGKEMLLGIIADPNITRHAKDQARSYLQVIEAQE